MNMMTHGRALLVLGVIHNEQVESIAAVLNSGAVTQDELIQLGRRMISGGHNLLAVAEALSELADQ